MNKTIPRMVVAGMLFSLVMLSLAPIASGTQPQYLEGCGQAPVYLAGGQGNTVPIGYPFVPTDSNNAWATGISPGYPANVIVSSSYTMGPPSYITVTYNSWLGGAAYISFCYTYTI